MNNKILLGSIIAVVILVLVSFTGVVGYQTTKSSTISKTSPLFAIRSSRAIDEDSKDLSCDYVGKGEEIELLIPKRDDEKILIQKFLGIVRKMDEKEMREIIEIFKEKLSEENMINNKNPLTMNCITSDCSTILGFWGPFCIMVIIISIPFLPIILPIVLLLELLHAIGLTYSDDDLCFWWKLHTLQPFCLYSWIPFC